MRPFMWLILLGVGSREPDDGDGHVARWSRHVWVTRLGRDQSAELPGHDAVAAVEAVAVAPAPPLVGARGRERAPLAAREVLQLDALARRQVPAADLAAEAHDLAVVEPAAVR